MSRRSRSSFALAAAALVGVLLAGCAASAPAEPDATAPADNEVSAAWLDGGAMVGLLLTGSSTCVPYADAVDYADGVLEVSLVDPDRACTRDAVLRGIAVPVPDEVDPADPLRVELSGGYRGSVELAGATGLVRGGGVNGGTPSAGWAGPDALAVLTWGSSGCPPQLETAEVTAAGEVTVTFATPDGDLVCTADMAPRVTPVIVSGAASGTAYELVLVGDGFDGTRIPVAGTP